MCVLILTACSCVGLHCLATALLNTVSPFECADVTTANVFHFFSRSPIRCTGSAHGPGFLAEAWQV